MGGTTSSVTALTSFKTGPFLRQKPVLPIVFNWSRNKSHDLSYIGNTTMMKDAFWAGCQVINYVDVTICEPFCPSNAEDLAPQRFAELTRILMGKHLEPHTTLTPHSLTDSLLYDFARIRHDYPIDLRFTVNDVAATYKLRSKTIQYLAQRFCALDRSNRGFIDFDDFCAAFKLDPVRYSEKMSKLFQLFSVNSNDKFGSRIGFDEFLNGVSLCFVDSMIRDAVRVLFDAASKDLATVSGKEILGVYRAQVDRQYFKDEESYTQCMDEMQLFVNLLFDFGKVEKLDFDTFYQRIMEKNLSRFVHEFLQKVVMLRLKIKLKTADFKIGSEEEDKVSVKEHPRVMRSDSIRSVGQASIGSATGNRL